MIKNKKISAVIACYKDAQAIPILYARLTKVFRKIKVNYEIIFVNDGSPDNSEEVIRKIVEKDSDVIGINHTRNFSSQMAFTSGMEIASGDAIVLLDGDLQDPPELIEKFYNKWEKGYEIVYGIRSKREGSFLQATIRKVFYRIFRKLSYISIPLDAGEFSLIDKRVTVVMQSFPERDRYIRGLRAWTGFRQIGIEYFRPKRMFGRSSNNFLSNFDWAIKGILNFSYLPLRFITLFSLFVFLLSLIIILILVVLGYLMPNILRGVKGILAILLFFSSVQLLSTSVLGEYIGKIFEEVKQRPKFVVKNIIRNKNL